MNRWQLSNTNSLDGEEAAEWHPKLQQGRTGPRNQEQLRLLLRPLNGLWLQTAQKALGVGDNLELVICSTEPGGPGNPRGDTAAKSLHVTEAEEVCEGGGPEDSAKGNEKGAQRRNATSVGGPGKPGRRGRGRSTEGHIEIRENAHKIQ